MEDLLFALNNSTDTGRSLYGGRDERELKLPSIYKKSLKKLQKITGGEVIMDPHYMNQASGNLADNRLSDSNPNLVYNNGIS